MKTFIIEGLLPIVGAIFAIVLPTVLTLAVKRFTELTGIQVENDKRALLQKGLANAALLAVSGGRKSDGIEYMRRYLPDTLTYFDIDDDDRISDLLGPHIAARGIAPADVA